MSTSFSTLISATALAGHLDDPNWRIVDCRHDLANTRFGRAAYEDGHLPGAVFAHLDEDLSSPPNGRNGRHPLPDPQLLAARFGAWGIDDETQVVAYDDAGGMYAARLWWLLRWLGHERVAVLDGGYQAWCRTAKVLTAEIPTPTPRKFDARVQKGAVDADALQAGLAGGEVLLIDARSPDRFRGENETLDPIGGHIPGAVNHFFRNNLRDDGCFKEAAALREEFGRILGGRQTTKVVHQCGSGVTACLNLLAMEAAGLCGSRLYPGSWSEWCADRGRPVATGPA